MALSLYIVPGRFKRGLIDVAVFLTAKAAIFQFFWFQNDPFQLARDSFVSKQCNERKPSRKQFEVQHYRLIVSKPFLYPLLL